MASSYVGGLSGAFIPVSEDAGMIDDTLCCALSLETLEARRSSLLGEGEFPLRRAVYETE